MARGGVGGEDRLGERVAVGQDDPRALGLLLERADEPLLAPLDDLDDLAVVEGLAVLAGAAVGDAGLDDVAADRAVVRALGDVEVLVGGGVGRDDEAEPALLARYVPTNSSLARLLAGQQDVAARRRGRRGPCARRSWRASRNSG